MAKNSQTGYDINIANKKSLRNDCVSLGSKFNPSSPELTLAAQDAQHAVSLAIHKGVNDLVKDLKDAESARRKHFEELEERMTAVIDMMLSRKMNPDKIEEARRQRDKLFGRRRGEKPKNEDGTPKKGKSVAQTSTDDKIGHYRKLVSTVAGDPLYATVTEPKLSVAGLKDFETLLETIIDNEDKAITALNIKREERYADQVKLVDDANAVKLYVRSVFGKDSAEFKLVSRHKFRKPTR